MRFVRVIVHGLPVATAVMCVPALAGLAHAESGWISRRLSSLPLDAQRFCGRRPKPFKFCRPMR